MCDVAVNIERLDADDASQLIELVTNVSYLTEPGRLSVPAGGCGAG